MEDGNLSYQHTGIRCFVFFWGVKSSYRQTAPQILSRKNWVLTQYGTFTLVLKAGSNTPRAKSEEATP